MQGRVAVLKAYGGDFERREYPVPDPEPGAILMRLTRAGVCGSDLHIWRGEMKEVYLEVGSIAPGNVFSYDATSLVRGNVRLVATSNYSPWALAQALAFLRRNLGRFPYERLVSHVFPLARITEAFQQADWMQRGGDGLRISRAALSMTD